MATQDLARPFSFRGLFTPLAEADDCGRIGLRHGDTFEEQMAHLQCHVYSPVVGQRAGEPGDSGPCCLRTAGGPGRLVDVLNTGPFELAVGQEVALIAPFVERLRYCLREDGGASLFSFPLTVAYQEAEKACLYYNAVKMASLAWADKRPDSSLLLEYLSPRVGDWARPIAEAAMAENAQLYKVSAIELSHLCDVAVGFHALLPHLRGWLADALGPGEAAEDSALRLANAVKTFWPAGPNTGTAAASDQETLGAVNDLLGALKTWRSQLELKPVGRVHRKMSDSRTVGPGEPFEILLYR